MDQAEDEYAEQNPEEMEEEEEEDEGEVCNCCGHGSPGAAWPFICCVGCWFETTDDFVLARFRTQSGVANPSAWVSM